MTKTSQQVWSILRDDISIQRNLQKGLINIRALAKYLIKNYYLNTSIDAIISAIRRYNFEIEDEKNKNITKSLAGSSVSTVTNLSCISLKESESIKQYLNNLYSITDVKENETLRIIDALQFYEANGEVCPADWHKGDKAMKPTQEGVSNYLANK